MFRLKVKRSYMDRPGFVIGTVDELRALAEQPDCEVLSDPYNPPGFPTERGQTYDAVRHQIVLTSVK